MAGATQHGVQSITERSFEGISGQSLIGLHFADGGFDGATPFDHLLEAAGNPPPLAGAQDPDAGDLSVVATLTLTPNS